MLVEGAMSSGSSVMRFVSTGTVESEAAVLAAASLAAGLELFFSDRLLFLSGSGSGCKHHQSYYQYTSIIECTKTESIRCTVR